MSNSIIFKKETGFFLIIEMTPSKILYFIENKKQFITLITNIDRKLE
jgi:hypothetical protein